MTRRILFTVALLAIAAGASAQGSPTPSTNDANRAMQWAHVDQLSIGVGTSDFQFVSTRSFFSCFEYRTDGDTSQKLTANGGVNYNTEITDGLYPYRCVYNSTEQLTIKATSYIEIRMVFGAERDERFDWTKFYVLGAQALKVKPWVYDPDDTGVAAAAWVTKEGRLDAGLESNHALYLAKQAPTATNAASGATIDGAQGLLTELGFDVRDDGHCGAGAPRFNVYTTAGTYYFFGCAYGVRTPIENGWTRVRFTDADAFPADGVTPFPGFAVAFLTGIEIVFDEGTDVGPGFVYIDNIDVNGVLMGKPGIFK